MKLFGGKVQRKAEPETRRAIGYLNFAGPNGVSKSVWVSVELSAEAFQVIYDAPANVTLDLSTEVLREDLERMARRTQ